MSFKVLHSSKIDAEKWNLCLNRYQMDIYNEFYFLNSVCLENWYGFVWGDYEKILPFYRKKKWGIIPYLCMPPFCQKFDNRPLSNNEWEEVLIYLKKKNLKIDFSVEDKKADVGLSERYNYVLYKKNQDIETIRKKYSSLLKKNIDKAKSSVIVKTEIAKQEKEYLYQKLTHFELLVLDKFSFQFDKLELNQLSGLYAIDMESNQMLAMLLYGKIEKKCYLLFPYTTEKGKKKQAMSFLIDTLIGQNELEIIDFEGSSIDSIANFYLQFGAEKHSYWTIHWKSRFLLI